MNWGWHVGSAECIDNQKKYSASAMDKIGTDATVIRRTVNFNRKLLLRLEIASATPRVSSSTYPYNIHSATTSSDSLKNFSDAAFQCCPSYWSLYPRMRCKKSSCLHHLGQRSGEQMNWKRLRSPLLQSDQRHNDHLCPLCLLLAKSCHLCRHAHLPHERLY